MALKFNTRRSWLSSGKSPPMPMHSSTMLLAVYSLLPILVPSSTSLLLLLPAPPSYFLITSYSPPSPHQLYSSFSPHHHFCPTLWHCYSIVSSFLFLLSHFLTLTLPISLPLSLIPISRKNHLCSYIDPLPYTTRTPGRSTPLTPLNSPRSPSFCTGVKACKC
jgi:hypothetical protein